MSVKLNGINNIYEGSYTEKIKDAQKKEQDEKQAVDAASEKTAGPAVKDEYIKGEEKEPIGLYRMEQDENGNPKIIFDNPESQAPEKAEECTVNTDRVDQEIKKIKEEKKQLQAASGDDRKTEEIKKKIQAVESELSQKDNDTYRRQHSVYGP